MILRGFGETTSGSVACFFYATATLAGALIPVPGGLGVTERMLEQQLHWFGGSANHVDEHHDLGSFRHALVCGAQSGSWRSRCARALPGPHARGQAHARSARSARMKSAGGSRRNRSASPVTGSTNPSTSACRACRPSCSPIALSPGHAGHAVKRIAQNGSLGTFGEVHAYLVRASGFEPALDQGCEARGDGSARTWVTARLPLVTRVVNLSRSVGCRPWSVSYVRSVARPTRGRGMPARWRAREQRLQSFARLSSWRRPGCRWYPCRGGARFRVVRTRAGARGSAPAIRTRCARADRAPASFRVTAGGVHDDPRSLSTTRR